MDGFDVFYPDRMASRILDLGDFKTLIENVQGAIDEEEARESIKRHEQERDEQPDAPMNVVDDIINCISYNVVFIVLFVKGVFYGI